MNSYPKRPSMSATSSVQPEDVPAREIVSTRTLDAPRDVVFRAFIDPSILVQWWGPEGFASTFREFDPRAGGVWRLSMRGPDGQVFEMEKRFVEVVPGERVVLQHIDPTHGFRMEMTFEDEAEKTRLTWRMAFDRAAEAERVREAVLVANEQNFDRLAARLADSLDRPPAPAA